MKKHRLIFLIVFIFSSLLISFIAKAQNNYEDVVYLKNGGIMHGMIIEQIPNVSLKIQTADRNVFVFKIDEIAKITREPVQTVSHKNLNVANKPSELENKVEIHMVDSLQRNKETVIFEMTFDRYDFQQKQVSFSTGINLILGYKISPQFVIGFGTGSEKTDNAFYVPTFIDMRYFILKKTLTPYVAARVGYTWGLGSDRDELDTGLLINPDAGIKFFVSNNVAMHFGIGYKYEEYYYPGGNHLHVSKKAHKFLNLNFGITI